MISVGTSSNTIDAGSSQRGPAMSNLEGNAAYNPPAPSKATNTGQRGSEFFGACVSTAYHALYSKRATSDSPRMTVSPLVKVASAIRSDFGSFTNVPLRES